MSVAEMKVAAIAEVNKINNKQDLIMILQMLSKTSLSEQSKISDLTRHFEFAKRRHGQILTKWTE